MKINKHIIFVIFAFFPLLFYGCAFKGLVKDKGETAADTNMPPRKAVDHYLKALSFEEARFYQGALVEYRRAAFFDTSSLELKLGVLRNYYRLEMLDSVVTEAERTLQKSPGDMEAQALLGQALVGMKRWNEACAVFKELTVQYPGEITFSAHLAAVCLEMKRPQEAAEIYGEIADSSEYPSGVYERAGGIMLVNDYPEMGLQMLQRALELDPGNHSALYSLGTLLLQKGENDSALAYFRLAMNAAPEEPKYALSAAFALSEMKNYSQAETLLTVSIEEMPDTPRLYNMLGSVLHQEKRYGEALETLRKSILLDTTDTAPYVTIGYIYDELDSVDKAVETYQKGLTVDSTDALLLNNYAYLLAEENIRLDAAIAMSAKALEKEPNNPSYLDTMGWLLYRSKNYAQAEDYIRKALNFDKNPVMYLHLGDILKESGQEQKALETYRQGLEIAPDNLDLKQRLETN